METPLHDDLLLAHRLADLADETSLPFHRRQVPHHSKHDGTPVSAADIATEAAVLRKLGDERPDDAVLTEESGGHGAAERRWIIDPIDGTESFLAGGRAWGTHVALEVAGEVRVAVITRPCDRLRWWAVRGGGAYRSDSATPMATGTPLRVSARSHLRHARAGGFISVDSGARVALSGRATWVEDPVSIVGALLEGSVDIVLDDGGQVWDVAPRTLLVSEAGGRFCDPHGGSRLDLGGGLYTNNPLQAPVRELLRGHRFDGPPRTVWR
ncbi:inositol monophosphatase family protein [Micromonospora schwarzwaldensis]|uniref:inositol monophosphatase family protein n=1 Tax=Micromonospora sp. DSM 45708 TaxID=3111767 RepID=UPI0031DD8A42